MPIPSKNPTETRDEFITRCIADLSSEYDTKQAAAICYLQLSKGFKSYVKGKTKGH